MEMGTNRTRVPRIRKVTMTSQEMGDKTMAEIGIVAEDADDRYIVLLSAMADADTGDEERLAAVSSLLVALLVRIKKQEAEMEALKKMADVWINKEIG